MSAELASNDPDATLGLRRFQRGAVFGLAGGVVGLVLPISINLVAFYAAEGILSFGTSLIALTSAFVLAGAILLAISLLNYRLGFGALRRFDRWFLLATVLCTVGSIGLLLIVVSTALAINSSPSLDQCIRGAPTQSLTCLKSIQPLSAYSVTVGFWLAWIGGLGIILGVSLGSVRYRDIRLAAGGAAYAVLLLVLIDPFLVLLFPLGGWQLPLLTIPILALLAHGLIYAGSRRALGS